jgi:release factor glutamine methyltransferase
LNKQWTILEALDWTEQRLAREQEENPRLAAQMLAAFATGLTRIELYTSFDKPLSDNERSKLRQSIQRRLEGEPLQYIIGSTGFRHLELKVRPPVLIPRPETELLVELVLEQAANRGQKELHILEIGTGTGAIALALLTELPACQVIATDIDGSAIALAKENAAACDFDEQRLELRIDDLASSLLARENYHHSFDAVVSNPPYIPTAEYEQLPDEIRHFESRGALDGGEDGLAVFRELAKQAATLLKGGGLLAMELHEQMLEEAAASLQCLPFFGVQIHPDLTARPRFLTALRGEV